MAKAKNLFDKARQEVASVSQDNTGGVEIKGLQRYAAIKAVQKALEAVAKEAEATAKSNMVGEFIKRGIASHHQPGNFEGREGSALAGCQLRKRTSASKLGAEEIEILTKCGISTEEVEAQKEAFTINTKYTNDQDLLAKISEKLNEIPDLPNDFIVMQPKVAYKITSDRSIEEVFATCKDETTLKALLQIVATPAIKLEKADMQEAIQVVSEILLGK